MGRVQARTQISSTQNEATRCPEEGPAYGHCLEDCNLISPSEEWQGLDCEIAQFWIPAIQCFVSAGNLGN